LGVITNVERKTKNTSLLIEVKPVVDPNKVEEVFVVKNAGEENFLTEPVEPSASQTKTTAHE
jgi:rod shape-determining protein MreC